MMRYVDLLQVAVLLTILVTQASGEIVNGDFEAGNIGFNSEYVYQPGSNTTEGEYTVRSDPQNWNPEFAATPDHTSGSGNMLVVNGATSGGPFLWQQLLAIDQATTYEFEAWISTAVSGNPADLIVKINGTQVGPTFVAPATTGSWEKWTISWNSGDATFADIQVFDTDLSTFPNDFFIDDISFAVVPEPSSLLAIAVACGFFASCGRFNKLSRF